MHDSGIDLYSGLDRLFLQILCRCIMIRSFIILHCWLVINNTLICAKAYTVSEMCGMLTLYFAHYNNMM